MTSHNHQHIDGGKWRSIRAAVLLLCCGCIANPATAGEDKVMPTLLPSGCTLKLLSSLLEQGPISDPSATREVIKRELGASLVEIPIGDPHGTWMVSHWRLAHDDALRLYPFQINLQFGKNEFRPGEPRGVSNVILSYWSTLCADNYAVVSQQLRNTYTPNRYLDPPRATTATKIFGKTSAEVDLLGPDGDGNVFGINIITSEKQ